jgi:hypothetical protein
MNEPAKGNGQPGTDKTRWVMRNNDGSEWETRGYYSESEVELFDCARPVRPLND